MRSQIKIFKAAHQGPCNEHFTKSFETLMDNCSDDSILEAALRAYEETEVVWSTRRMTRAAGRASYVMLPGRQVKNLKITLSRPYFEELNEDQKFNTCSHEFAHIVDAILRGKSAHDWAWKRLHRLMGGSGERCHTYKRPAGTQPRQPRRRSAAQTVVDSGATKYDFRAGDKVSFTAKGRRHQGVVVQRLRKNVKVKTDAGEWRCPPSLLTKED
jgi:predicted SprT family Zn-dependent metalloprotease